MMSSSTLHNLHALTSVHTEYPIVDDDRKGEEVEHVCEIGPHVGASVLAHAFRVEAVSLGERGGVESGVS